MTRDFKVRQIDHVEVFVPSRRQAASWYREILGLDRLESHPVFDQLGQRRTRGDAVDHEQAFSIYFNDPHGNRYEITTYDHQEVREGREMLAC